MVTLSKSILLFTLNWLDAQLTLLWLRLHVASEGNKLMASLLDVGEAPFLTVKLTIGAFAPTCPWLNAECAWSLQSISC